MGTDQVRSRNGQSVSASFPPPGWGCSLAAMPSTHTGRRLGEAGTVCQGHSGRTPPSAHSSPCPLLPQSLPCLSCHSDTPGSHKSPSQRRSESPGEDAGLSLELCHVWACVLPSGTPSESKLQDDTRGGSQYSHS